MLNYRKVTVKCIASRKFYPNVQDAHEVSDIAALMLRKPHYNDLVLGVYCGLRLDAEVCRGMGEGGRGMVV